MYLEGRCVCAHALVKLTVERVVYITNGVSTNLTGHYHTGVPHKEKLPRFCRWVKGDVKQQGEVSRTYLKGTNYNGRTDKKIC